jgi:pimeloyl-ACP methyl ester carboxylesterase
LSFGGALALAFAHRHPTVPRSLVVVSGYAGWRGSLPPSVAEDRLQQAIRLSELSGERLAATLLPTMFDTAPPSELLAAFGDSLRTFHPGGFRAMAQASAEDLRDALADIAVPTLLVYGDRDVRAPIYVAEHLHAALPDSTLVVLEGVGHVCNLEAPDEFNETLRSWASEHP